MRAVDLVIAGMFALGGVRSIWVWSRRPFDGRDVVDHLLYALYLTGRVGMWFAFAGFFLIYASIEVRGRAAFDELATYRWYLLVPLWLATLQLVAGWLLGRRAPFDEGDDRPTERPRTEPPS